MSCILWRYQLTHIFFRQPPQVTKDQQTWRKEYKKPGDGPAAAPVIPALAAKKKETKLRGLFGLLTLLGVMAELAGDQWTTNIEHAWRDALQAISELMLQAYEEQENDMAASRKEVEEKLAGLEDEIFWSVSFLPDGAMLKL